MATPYPTGQGPYPTQTQSPYPPPQQTYPPPPQGYQQGQQAQQGYQYPPPSSFVAQNPPQSYGSQGYQSQEYQPVYPPAYADEESAGAYGQIEVDKPFDDPNVRQSFIRKVFALLSIMLIVVTVVTALFLNNDHIHSFIRHHSWVSLVACGMAICSMLPLICCEGLARKHPTNLVVLGIFTFAQAFMVATVCCFYSTHVVMKALAITAFVTVGITAFAMQTKIDFTFMAGALCLVGMVLMGMSIFMIFFHSRLADLLFSGLGAFLFGLWLLVDVQMIVGGSHSQQFDPEDYVFAVLTLFMDIINLFLYILRLVELLDNSSS